MNKMISGVGDKTKEQLLEEFSARNTHNTLEGEQYSAAIMVKCAEDISGSINDFEETAKKLGESSEILSKKIFWLNIILTAATAIGAIATLLLTFK